MRAQTAADIKKQIEAGGPGGGVGGGVGYWANRQRVPHHTPPTANQPATIRGNTAFL